MSTNINCRVKSSVGEFSGRVGELRIGELGSMNLPVSYNIVIMICDPKKI